MIKGFLRISWTHCALYPGIVLGSFSRLSRGLERIHPFLGEKYGMISHFRISGGVLSIYMCVLSFPFVESVKIWPFIVYSWRLIMQIYSNSIQNSLNFSIHSSIDDAKKAIPPFFALESRYALCSTAWIYLLIVLDESHRLWAWI